MRSLKSVFVLFAIATLGALSLFAQGYLSGKDANKKLVTDFYRLCFEPRNVDLVPQYIAEDFVEHNPRYQSGRDNFTKMLAAAKKPGEDPDIGPEMRNPPALVVAEGDLVTFIFKRMAADPKDAAKKYERFTFDAFRINNGKIAEHWDGDAR